MKTIAILCDVAAELGGAERYWATVIPRLAERYDIRLFARVVAPGAALGAPATQIAWADDESAPQASAAAEVAAAIRGVDAVITANVFDAGVLEAVRSSGARWIARVHDPRPFCPNGNKVFPQFRAFCDAPMGGACVVNSALRGCVCGPRSESLRRIRRRMRVRAALTRADAVLVSSAFMRAMCAQNGVPAESVAITPPPLADAFFAPSSTPKSNSVLYAGRVQEEKGLKSLVRAVATIGAARRPSVVVAGRGSAKYEQDVRILSQAMGVDVRWRGYLDQLQLRDAIDSARVFALPSLWPEPFGLGATQALARSRPVVAYDVGGVRDWIPDPYFAVKPRDERAFGAAIDRLCNDDDAWRRASSEASITAQKYKLSNHLDQLLPILDPGVYTNK